MNVLSGDLVVDHTVSSSGAAAGVSVGLRLFTECDREGEGEGPGSGLRYSSPPAGSGSGSVGLEYAGIFYRKERNVQTFVQMLACSSAPCLRRGFPILFFCK